MRVRQSLLKNYDRCPRLGRLSEVYETPPSPAQQFGTDVHTAIETILRGGTVDESAPAVVVAMRGRDHWPAPERIIGIERNWTRVYHGPKGPVTFTGTADLLTEDNGIRTVWDHKTSSNPKRYGLTSETLCTDTQAILYAWALDATRVCWIYYGTKTPIAYRVGPVELSRDVLEAGMRRLYEKAIRIRPYQEVFGPEIVTRIIGNYAACGDFGGCYFRNICGNGGNMSVTDVNELMKKLRAKAVESGVQPPNAEAERAAEIEPAMSEAIAAAATPLPPDIPPTPPKRGRPKKIDAPEPVAEVVPVDTIDTPPSYTLYENAIPLGEDFIDAETLIHTAAELVQTQHGVADYGLIDFGKGPAALCAALEGIVRGLPSSPAIVALSSRRVSHTIDVFRRHAAKIVKGLS